LVENQGDGWAVASAYLDRFLDDVQLLAPDATLDPGQHAAYLLGIRQIGRRVAELHHALASCDSEPAFAPEPVIEGDLAAWQADLVALAERAFDNLAHRCADLPEPTQPLAVTLLQRREEAMALVREAVPRELGVAKIRHHGDLHLGQVLIVKDDVFIIDFEGEPERSIEWRRRKAPAARDVAGLIRSIDYAAMAALDRRVSGSPEERARLSSYLDDWRVQCVETLRASYRETCADSRLWPEDTGTADRLVSFFLLEKVFYEIGYELASRPAWVHVPLTGAIRLLFPVEEPAA
jgi:maltose alpha-D-glucosyltransferase/alpha-amylase